MAHPRKDTKKTDPVTKPSAVMQAGFKPVIKTNPIPVDLIDPGPKVINVYSLVYQMWHPFQKKMIPVNDPTPVIYDSWVKCQIEGGRIKEE